MEMIIDISANRPHEVAELICLNCHSRAIHVYPADVLLKDLECKCGEKGLLIKTGQTLPKMNICQSCVSYTGNECKLHLLINKEYCDYYRKVDDGSND